MSAAYGVHVMPRAFVPGSMRLPKKPPPQIPVGDDDVHDRLEEVCQRQEDFQQQLLKLMQTTGEIRLVLSQLGLIPPPALALPLQKTPIAAPGLPLTSPPVSFESTWIELQRVTSTSPPPASMSGLSGAPKRVMSYFVGKQTFSNVDSNPAVNSAGTNSTASVQNELVAVDVGASPRATLLSTAPLGLSDILAVDRDNVTPKHT
jgi:hypothetical protein